MPELSLGERVDLALQNFRKAKLELEYVQELFMQEADLIKGVRITKRETEILRGVIRGLCNKEIARDLNICVRTVKYHISSLLLKTGTAGRTELLRAINEKSTQMDTPIVPIRASGTQPA
jgi:DNA-binding NarL/FixJ family response regulator